MKPLFTGNQIETSRLILRPATMDDASFIQNHFSQPDVLHNLPPEVPNPYPADGATYYLSQMILPSMEKGQCMEFIIHRKSDMQPMGAVMVEQSNEQRGEWRRGFWLANEYRGQKYMEEASLAALHWLFDKTEAQTVITGNAVSNHASARIKQKQGFLPAGTMVQMPPFHNGDTEKMVWELTRERFTELYLQN